MTTRQTLALTLLAAFLVASFAVPTAEAASCGWGPDKTPSKPAPQELWGGLEPTEMDGLPSNRDNTAFDRNGFYSHTRPFFRSIDVADGWLFTGYNLGLQVYNARGAFAEEPLQSGVLRVESLPFLNRNPHNYFLITDVDLPDGESDVLVMTGWDAVGLVMVDVSDKNNPRVVYQDSSVGSAKYGEGVYAAKIAGKHYAFMASQRAPGAGLWMYDMSEALDLFNGLPCAEKRPGLVNPACSGVFKRTLSNDNMSHVDGTGNYLAFSGGLGGSPGMQVWNVGNPNAPVRAFNAFADRRVDGVAMWEGQGKVYLAVGLRLPDEVQIFDVSCLKNGTCGSNPLTNPIYDFPAPGTGLTSRLTLQHSKSNSQDYLHVGRTQSYFVSGLQAEWLLDVSDPANPVDLAGGDPRNGNAGQPTTLVDGEEVGYWSWYHACHSSGSNSFEPADGVVYDGLFYRAGSSILDAHKLKNLNPRITIEAAAASTYQDTPLTVTANAFNCTPNANGWTWSAPGGTVTGSSATVQVQWPSTGNKMVSATNSACGAAEVIKATVQVQQAAPAVGSVTADVSSPLVCSPVTFTANGVSGKPTLSYAWELLDGSGSPAGTLNVASGGLSAVWDTAQAPQPAAGTYTARFTVTNSVSAEKSKTVNLQAPAPLGFSAGLGTSVDFGDVDFTANSVGATEWRWSFGDGSPLLVTSDPVLGPAPRHRYDEVGNYPVTVEIRNCLETTWQSQTGTAVVSELNPLEITTFKPTCRFGPCAFTTNANITFELEVSGDPDLYDYDWDGNGTFEDADHPAPVTQHSYAQPGVYQPRVRIRRGNAEKVATGASVVVSSGKPPAISVSGPTQGEMDTQHSFTASATNCTPGNANWSWSASGGGNVIGNGNSVKVVWSSSGLKSVTATNSDCGSASGSRSITIKSDDAPPPPPNLDAKFVYSPTAPDQGEEVTFDASGSTGSPSAFLWKFGDGKTASGKSVTHTYTESGSYNVTLEVSKAGSGCSFGLCVDTLVKPITVVPTGPTLGSNGCSGAAADDPSTLCLAEGRFEVDVSWLDHHNGDKTGLGGAKRHSGSDVTGFFWFFNPNNVELIVKILKTAGGDHWVFYGGLSDVYYKMTVTDTETNQSKVYENLAGTICGKADTSAFLIGGDDEQEALKAGASSGALHFPATDSGVGVVHDAAFRPDMEDEEEDEAEEEVEPSDTLALLGGRFEVTVDWVNQHDGNASGVGTAVPGTNQTGYFWFFNERNLEVVVKMVDGRAVNDHWWVFWGGLSDTNYTVTVHDTVLDRTWTRTNPPGSFCGGSDVAAFSKD